MPSAVVVCPSGLTGEIRSFKLKELRAFLEGGRRDLSRSLTAMLQSCWLRTDDPGPYGEKFTWGKALYRDRLWAWLQARMLGFGGDIDFEFQCESEVCRDLFPRLQVHAGHLDTITMRPLSDDSKAAFSDGNRFETSVEGKAVAFRLLTGDLEAFIEDRKRECLKREGRKRNAAENAADLLIDVGGIGSKYRELVAWVDDLDAGDVARLGEEMTAADCGVDLTTEVQCENCRRIMRVEIPFVENFTRLAKKQTAAVNAALST